MQTENRFIKGVVADYDPSDVDNTTMVFPTINCRVFNKKGQGFIATNLESNELAFSLSDGFIAIGAREFNGVLYIVSTRYVDSTTSYCEIGSYPSPLQSTIPTIDLIDEVTIDTTIIGFDQIYKPLGNLYALGARRRFTIVPGVYGNYLNWTQDNPVDIKIKESYDDSVDLYIADYVHSNKVINSGFNQDGVYTDRIYTLLQLKGYTDLIPSTDTPMKVELTSIDNGGNLSPGSYWLFFKYVTKSFASTKFCTEIGPIQISIGALSLDVQGIQEKDWLHNIENKANKKMVLVLSEIDPSYDYIQVGVLRYSAFTENGSATTDTYLIDKYFKIDGTTLEVEVTGYETEAILTLEDISEGVIPYNICKNQPILNGRYLGVSWKKQHNYSDDIREHMFNFAQAITISFQNVGCLQNDGNETNISSLPQYKDPLDVEQHLGYFKGEVYPFGVKFVFSNGYISEAFPCISSDGMPHSFIIGTYTDKGLYRFPDYTGVFGIGGSINFATVLAVSFNIEDALSYKNDPNNSDFFADIIGFYFVRGTRIENMIGQGIMTDVVNYAYVTRYGGSGVSDKRYFDGGDGSQQTTGKYIPGIRRSIEINNLMYYQINSPIGFHETDVKFQYQNGRVNYLQSGGSGYNNRFALFAPDYIFTENQVNEGDTYYLKFVRTSYPEVETKSNWLPTIIKDREPSWGSTIINSNWYTCTLNNVGLAVTGSGNNFVSLLKDGETYSSTTDKGFYVKETGTSLEVYQYNRSIVSQKYLGIIITDNDWDIIPEERSIIAIYKSENNSDYFEDVLNNFDISTCKYSKISSFIPLSATQTTYSCFKGDCYWQNTFIRALRMFGKDGNALDYDYGGTYYQHGLVLGFWSENKVNTAMRNEVRFRGADNTEGLYTYYPKLLSTGESLYGWLESKSNSAMIEATQINDGYNKNMSIVQAIGYDDTVDLSDTSKKNRIYFSDKQVVSSQIDAFRNISVNSYQDFITENNDFTSVEIFKGRILGVLKNSLIEIYADERVITSQQAGEDLIAASRNYISDRFRIIENYGSQQKFGILGTPNGVYGYDWLRRIFWRTTLHITDTGSSVLVSEDLSKSKFIQTYFESLLGSIITSTDITQSIGDNPILFDGVHIGYDKKNADVLLTILNKDSNIFNTLVFNENINAFTGEYSFTPSMYANINNDFFSVEPDLINNLPTKNFYKHNILGSYQSFYEVQDDFKLSFIINANKSKEGVGEIVKIFESLEIEMPEIIINRMVYATEYQSGSYSFNITSVEDKSEYEDNAWKVPVIMSMGSGAGQYDEDSELTGRWLRVTIEYNPDGDAEALWIKKVISNFSIRY